MATLNELIMRNGAAWNDVRAAIRQQRQSGDGAVELLGDAIRAIQAYPPGDVTNIRSVTQGRVNRIKWRDPDDLVVDGVLLAGWSHTKLVRKLGGYPVDPNDGTLIWTGTVRNACNTVEYIDQLPSDDVYFYQLFPVAVSGMVNMNAENRFTSNSMTWTTVRDIVQTGNARRYFGIGDVLTTEHAAYGTIYWEIAGFDQMTPADAEELHSMTLFSKRVLVSLQFDALEKSYALTADTVFHSEYLLNLTGYAGADGDYFLVDESAAGNGRMWLQRGGPIRIQWDGGNGRWAAFNAETAAVAASQTVAGTEPWLGVWSGGIAVAKAKKYYVFDGTNYSVAPVADGGAVAANTYYEANPAEARVNYGYNSWKQSGMRQWMNSAASAGAWWEPQHIWDNPPTYANTLPGFVRGFADAEFTAAVGAVKLTTANSMNDGRGSYVVSDKFFIASPMEVFGAANNGVNEGSLMELYEGASQTDRVKLNSSGSAPNWLLRSPKSGYVNYLHSVAASGALSMTSAHGVCGVVPVCVIC